MKSTAKDQVGEAAWRRHRPNARRDVRRSGASCSRGTGTGCDPGPPGRGAGRSGWYRVLRPMSSTLPAAAWRSTTRPASQATRRATSFPTWMPPACSMTAWSASRSAAGAAGAEAAGLSSRVSAEIAPSAAGAGSREAARGLRCHVHGHLVTIAGAARIERAGQRALGHQSQRIRTPLRDGGRLVLLRGRRHLLQRRLQGAQHHRAHLGGQPRAQHQHAGFVHPRAQRAACQPHLLGIRLRHAVGLPLRAHQPLDLRGGGAAGDGDQARLGGRGGGTVTP